MSNVVQLKYTGKIAETRQYIVDKLRETEREGIDDLVDWLDNSDYFTAPASTRLDFHGCEEGGLAQHSINVYKLFEEKAERYDFDIGEDEVVIAALCHDMCKVNQYVPNVLKSGNLSSAKPYVVKDDFPFGHGEKSAMITGRHIELTLKESMLIRWHMGHFDGEWENYEHKVAKVCPEIYAFQYADEEASKYMDYRKN